MLSTTTEFPHISTAVLRFLEWALPQVQQRGRRGAGGSALTAGVPPASAPLAGGRPQAGRHDSVADVVALPEGADGAGAQRLLAAAGEQARRRLTALAGASPAWAPAERAAPPTRIAGASAGPPGSTAGRRPASAVPGRQLPPGAVPGTASGSPLTPLGGEQAVRPPVRLTGAPGPPSPTSQAERAMNSLAPELRAFTTPQAQHLADRLAPALWSTQCAAAQFAAAARTSAGGPAFQIADLAAGAAPTPYTQPGVPYCAGPDSRLLAAPDSRLMAVPSIHTTNRLLAEAQLRQMLADIIQADALRHGLNLKER